MALLEVENLRTVFPSADGGFAAVDGVSFALQRGEILGIVGESGSGKSVTAFSLMRLVAPPGEIVSGRIALGGTDLAGLGPEEMRAVRGRRIAMIFQEPMSSLNPLYTVGAQIIEPLRVHERLGRREARARALAMLEMVGVPDPAERIGQYPHQLSGGLRQRVMIAMALVCRPQVLIADEPTTALDVTIQAQILDLLRRLRDELGMAVILITHDLGVVCELADTVHVMYAGRIVEKARTNAIFERPRHPYTEALLRSIPDLDRNVPRLPTIEGAVPKPGELPPGCRFAPRCPSVRPACAAADPPLHAFDEGHEAACIRELGDGAAPARTEAFP